MNNKITDSLLEHTLFCGYVLLGFKQMCSMKYTIAYY